MEKDMDDCEFWLPSEILTDEDIFMEHKPKGFRGSTGSPEATGVHFPAVSPYEFGSHGRYPGLAAPEHAGVYSGFTTETESDEEEDYLAGLTQKMAHSSLQESSFWRTDSKHFGYDTRKHQAASGSPQSTLCGFTGCGSPNCPSPPAFHRSDGAWELLCAAAGEVARMRMVEEAAAHSRNRGRRPMVPPRQRPNLGLLSDKSLSYQQLQVEKFRQLQKQQMMKQQESSVVQNRGRPLGLAPSAWPTLHQSQHLLRKQQPGSGMRAVFLGDAVAKKQCAGTGVFLPRPMTESNRKPATRSSTVLLPERVIQTLNMNAMEAPTQLPPRFSSPFTPHHDAGFQCKVFQGQEMQHQGRSMAGMMNQEFQLPLDWTY